MIKLELADWIEYGLWIAWTAITWCAIIEWSLLDRRSLQASSYSPNEQSRR
jgi:hypothetical protein